jgi:trehalose synthase
MLQTVDVGERSLDAYRGVAPDPILDRLRELSVELRGLRVLHLNATPYGGGVSELLRSGIPILNDLGLVAEWKVISGDETFFSVTKAIHNGLQGAERSLTESERATYAATSERNAALLEEEYDVIVVHDPQPAGILSIHGKGESRWIWRCHIDTASPNPEVWAFLRSYLDGYDTAIFTMREFLPPDLPIAHVEIVPPAIDPLSPKNLDIGEQTALQVLSWIGVDLDRPLVTQVSRFDPWKDPLGVIAAYRLAREEVPGLQLALAGSMALDDPEGWEIHREIQRASLGEPLIHVFTNLTGVGNIEVNAFQRLSQVVVQKSIREGFGLVVSEALWKGTPVVAGRAGGIPLQLADGVGGVLVESIEECAQAIAALLGDPDLAGELGRNGRERVREHFLLPRLILDELTLIRDLVTGSPVTPPSAERDPVCGMALSEPDTAPSTAFAGATYRFCSDDCRARFELTPERYVARGAPDPPAEGEP